MSDSINIKNKKANFLFELSDKVVAGIQLLGTEIKSIRNNKASIKEAYCTFVGKELVIRNMHVAEYFEASYNNHEPKRDRKLLLNRTELDKYYGKVRTKGFTIIPVRLFINNKGLAKMEIALGKGKNVHDKRQDLKAKDDKREMDRVKKEMG
ncbi:MAG: SsrA-binding protein SmpB [Flavobacteriales bacterium]|nr:SsrA-binding protein SmpB [Flavobacteriales bacterium]